MDPVLTLIEKIEDQALELQRRSERVADRELGDLALTVGVTAYRLIRFAADLRGYLAERGERLDATDFSQYVAGELARLGLTLPR